jgi:hypothetical protein
MLRACVLSWKGSWEDHLALAEFAYNNSYQASIKMAPFEALYGRRCISPLWWETLGERSLVGPDWVQQTSKKVREIRQNILAAQSHQKSYADVRRRDLEFAVGDQVLLRVSPTKGVVRFGVSGKLSPRYIGPFTILARVGSLAYRLLLPDSMAGVHPVFHVFMLRKFLRDPDHQIEMEPIAVQQDLTLECRPVRILEFSERVLRKRSIKYVKVVWSNQSEREATWELEELMRQKYLELFGVGKCCWFIKLSFCRSDRSVRIRGRILFKGGRLWYPVRKEEKLEVILFFCCFCFFSIRLMCFGDLEILEEKHSPVG